MASTSLFGTLNADEVRSLQNFAWLPSKELDVGAWNSHAYSLAIDALLALDTLYGYPPDPEDPRSIRACLSQWSRMLNALDDLASPVPEPSSTSTGELCPRA
jgi:hypothetical protein